MAKMPQISKTIRICLNHTENLWSNSPLKPLRTQFTKLILSIVNIGYTLHLFLANVALE